MHFSGVTLALVSPVNHELVSRANQELTYTPVQSLSTTITYGAGAYD